VPVAWPARSPDLNPLDVFLLGCVKCRVYPNGRPEARHELVHVVDGDAVGIRNEVGRLQWHNDWYDSYSLMVGT
jgi:hypothetical protein